MWHGVITFHTGAPKTGRGQSWGRSSLAASRLGLDGGKVQPPISTLPGSCRALNVLSSPLFTTERYYVITPLESYLRPTSCQDRRLPQTWPRPSHIERPCNSNRPLHPAPVTEDVLPACKPSHGMEAGRAGRRLLFSAAGVGRGRGTPITWPWLGT